MKTTVAVRTLAENMAGERKEKRFVLLDDGGNISAVLGRLPGPPCIGKDENGQPLITRPVNYLKIRLSGMRAEITYRREESGKIDETFVEGAKIPRRKITLKTDIFRALRSVKHVRERYEKEFEKRDEILGKVERINAELATREAKITRAHIESLENRLDALVGEMSLDKAAVKKLGRFKIEEIYEYLEPAKYLYGFQKEAMIAAACSKLVAFRNRYGTWRDGQVARIMAYNKLRECSLRMERDNALANALNRWADFIEKFQYAAPKLWKKDEENVRKIGGLIALIKTDFHGALARLVEIGQKLKRNGIEKEAKNELRYAYRGLKCGNAENGIWHLKRAAEILEWNKPWYVLEQLEKSDESYMQPTIERIRKAQELLFEKNVVGRSAELFREAARKI